MSKPIILNDRWRISFADPIQWLLERQEAREGKPQKWNAKAFCRTQRGLMLAMLANCGSVTPDGFAQVRELPAHREPLPVPTPTPDDPD